MVQLVSPASRLINLLNLFIRIYNNNNISNSNSNNKQLLDEVEHDIRNYQTRGLCYLPKPKAEADNTDLGFDNS